MEMINETPFVLEKFVVFSKEAAETLVVILKATYELFIGKPPVVADDQDPLNFADEYMDEPGQSGLLLEGEFMAPKPTTGVLLSGHAVAPNGNTTSMAVGLQVGNVSQKAIVYGERRWRNTLVFSKISKPEPFDRIALTWENAFGGTDLSPSKDKHKEAQPDNPVGKGFFARYTTKKIADQPLPNIEHFRHIITSPRDRPPPVGFCPVAPNWQPRVGFTGMYDEKWQEQRAPLLPDDFDERFYQSSPPALTASGYLSGGEMCQIAGTTRGGRLVFSLPRVQPDLQIRFDGPSGVLRISPLQMRLDTVHIDTDRMRLHLVWRDSKDVHGRLEMIRAVEARVRVKV